MKVLEERSRRMSVASTGWHITEPDVAPQQAHCSPEQEKNVARLVAARAATRAATANLVQCAKRLADIIDDNKKAFLDMAMVELEGFVRQSLGIPDDFDFPEDPDTPEDAE
ncbi:MAG TPA: hypothetical protein VNI01_10060 [Elusimicrobiota bacterium]|jgi:hypothetical protein|nr:hypothetical protein [Elusimicrobiota bacterium]